MNFRRLMRVGVCALLVLLGWPSLHMTQATGPTTAILQLTSDPAIDVRPAWSPDNRTIAFQSNRNSSTFHIYLMNVDGSNQHPLTKGSNDDRHPMFTPDGKSILFDSDDGTHEEIWMVNVADGSLKQLTHHADTANFATPSPDGQHIAYYLYKDETLDLWTARIDGSEAKRLTHDLASAKNNQCTFACHNAAWSPDSKQIAYSGGNHQTIWMMRSDGSDNKQVIVNEEHNHFPWFMADGRLGYITEHVSPVQSWTDAWLYDFQLGQAKLMQEQMSPQGPFEWSNDYTKVLFHSPRSGNFDIYLIDLSAQDGLAALQGTPVPVERAASAATPGAPGATVAPIALAPASTTTPTSAGSNTSTIGVFGVIGVIVAGSVGVALLAWLRRRDEWN